MLPEATLVKVILVKVRTFLPPRYLKAIKKITKKNCKKELLKVLHTN